MKISNKVYDILKFVIELLLPGLGALYFALAGIWGFPYGEQIIGTITAIETFLGIFLKASSVKYNKEQKELQETQKIFTKSEE